MNILQVVGHVISVIFLLSASLSNKISDWFARSCVAWIQSVTGAIIPRDYQKFHSQRETNPPLYEDNDPKVGVINEKVTLASASFNIAPVDLIAKTKELLSPEAEFGSKKPELLAEDFQFVFPVVGPLTKTEFCTIFSSFKVKDAFPDSCNNFFGFTVDPMEPNRVWYFSRAKMTHSGTLKFGSQEFPPTGKEVVCSPQVFSMSFDQEGRCYKFTGGYCVDRTTGNCGGLGGLFGIIHSVGGSLPFPEGKPWRPSLEWEIFSKRVPELLKWWKGSPF